MLHRIAYKLIRNFCIDWSQLKRTKWTKLEDRTLLILQGPDSHKLLQGLITNDLRELKEKKVEDLKIERIALFTLFLQPKGKVLTDAFIFRPRVYQKGKPKYLEDELWLDIDKSAKTAIKQHLHRHMWRKKAQMIDIEEQAQHGHIPILYAGHNEENMTPEHMLGTSVELEEMESGEEGGYANLIYFDPRGSRFGLRIVSSQEHLNVQGHFETVQYAKYNKIMESLGMPARSLFENRLPFQFNFDFFHAISLKKGCYIGQEIISRGFLTGIIRRRLFPFILDQQHIKVAFDEGNSTIKLDNGEELGKIVTLHEGSGLALINYLPLVEREWPINFDSPFRGQLMSPFGDKLRRYVSDMKGKQKMLEDLDL